MFLLMCYVKRNKKYIIFNIDCIYSWTNCHGCSRFAGNMLKTNLSAVKIRILFSLVFVVSYKFSFPTFCGIHILETEADYLNIYNVIAIVFVRCNLATCLQEILHIWTCERLHQTSCAWENHICKDAAYLQQ